MKTSMRKIMATMILKMIECITLEVFSLCDYANAFGGVLLCATLIVTLISLYIMIKPKY